jgi:hypothetical protein
MESSDDDDILDIKYDENYDNLLSLNRYRRRIYCRYCLKTKNVKWYNFVIALMNK